MPRRSISLAAAAIVGHLCLVPAMALAGRLAVSVEERPDGAVIHLRTDDETIPEPDIARSPRGMLLFFPGQSVEAERIYSKSRRLRFVQTGTARGRAAVRVVQRPSARGHLREYAHLRPVPGGYDIEVIDSYPPALEKTSMAEADATPDTSATVNHTKAEAGATDTHERAAALAALVPEAAPQSPPEIVSDPAPPPATEGDIVASNDAPKAPSEPNLDNEPEPTANPGPAPFDTQPLPNTPARAQVLDLDTPAPPDAASWWMGGLLLLVGGAGLAVATRARSRRGGSLEVREKVQLGPKQSVVCVRVGGRDLLIGATEHTVALLAELDADSADPPTAPANPPVSGTDGKQPDAPPTNDATAAKLAAFKRRLAEAMADPATSTDPPTPDTSGVSTGVEFSIPSRDPAWVRHREVA